MLPEDDAFSRALARVLKTEGGYANDPADSGGATRYGITEAVARANGYTGEMRDLPVSVAAAIYRRQYWSLLRLDAVAGLSEPLAIEVFDSAVNCGAATAAKWLQRALNALNDQGSRWPDLTVDGLIGPMTLAALAAQMRRPQGETVLLRALNALQGAHYIELAERRPKDERFLAGWLLHRVNFA